MKARTTVLIAFVAAVFFLATVSRGYAAQTTSDQARTYKQNQSENNPNFNNDLSGSQNGAGSQAVTPRTSNPLQPVIIRRVGWSWLLISGLIGFLLGRITNRRRRHGSDEDIGRNRAA